ncbi:MAG: transglycosylase SLT domain-containing protein [Rikenellaceae bacterium]|nr:transglycosylase SLT domain-containing protein [Rikenellaceae bacterium]
MVRNVILTVIPISLTLLFLSTNRKNTPQEFIYRDKIQQADRLTVALDKDIAGHFIIDGKSYGIQYEMLEEYANLLGLELEIISDHSPYTSQALLEEGKINMAAVMRTHIANESNIPVAAFRSNYVIMSRRDRKTEKISSFGEVLEKLDGKSLLVAPGFTSSKSFDLLLDSLKNTETYLTSKRTIDIMKELSVGNYDYIICEKTEALMGKGVVKNVMNIFEFEEEIPVYVLFNREDSLVAQHFESWLNVFERSDKYAELNRLYNGSGINDKIFNTASVQSGGRISKFDNIIKRIAEQEKMDWRLISAIAYQESKFNPDAVSNKGACGLMQVMPKVAEQFNYCPDDLLDVETNITVAVQLLKTIEKSIIFDNNTDIDNKISIILACYNCGIGHVLDARRLATKYGENPNNWKNVKKYLALKSNAEIIADEAVRSGRFNGIKETSAFVSNVRDKYASYCQIASL